MIFNRDNFITLLLYFCDFLRPRFQNLIQNLLFISNRCYSRSLARIKITHIVVLFPFLSSPNLLKWWDVFIAFQAFSFLSFRYLVLCDNLLEGCWRSLSKVYYFRLREIKTRIEILIAKRFIFYGIVLEGLEKIRDVRKSVILVL